MSIQKYLHERMLKHAGVLRESIYKNRQEELADVYSDTYKDAHGFRPRWDDFSKYSEEELTKMIEDLYAEMNEKIEDQSWYDELDTIHAAEEQEIASLKPGPGEAALEKMPPGGKMAVRHESKMRVTSVQLQHIIKEEVFRVLNEMEIVNFDSGELLTVDQLPPKYAGRLTKDESGYDALYDQDFEALRRDLELDPDDALGMLEDYASEEMGAAGGDLGTAIDIAMGFKMSYPKEWKAALAAQRIKNMYYEDEEMEFDTIDDALARFLAERMG
jgi:hypothetical protein